MAEEVKQNEWMKKMDYCLNNGYPMCWALDVYLSNKEKPMDEILKLIDEEIIKHREIGPVNYIMQKIEKSKSN